MRAIIPVMLLLAAISLSGCQNPAAGPFVSEVLPPPAAHEPMLAVHMTDSNTVVRMDFETYLAGVVAGEMPNSWPLEALKAQAILARTFVLKFVSEKDSIYPGADISTDITEAQAYNAAAVNKRILQAVEATAGQILLTSDGALPYTWFHSHSGGRTETARAGLDWQGEEPSHTRVADGMESDKAAWTASFPKNEFLDACRETGAHVASCSSVSIGPKGASGRAESLLVDGTAVNAARLRISLGSTKMRSTLLTELYIEDNTVHMSGFGYGHGVGMSQWGAHELARRGWSAEEIALHYYRGVHIVKAW